MGWLVNMGLRRRLILVYKAACGEGALRWLDDSAKKELKKGLETKSEGRAKVKEKEEPKKSLETKRKMSEN
jgi:hypothetical protein